MKLSKKSIKKINKNKQITSGNFWEQKYLAMKKKLVVQSLTTDMTEEERGNRVYRNDALVEAVEKSIKRRHKITLSDVSVLADLSYQKLKMIDWEMHGKQTYVFSDELSEKICNIHKGISETDLDELKKLPNKAFILQFNCTFGTASFILEDLLDKKKTNQGKNVLPIDNRFFVRQESNQVIVNAIVQLKDGKETLSDDVVINSNLLKKFATKSDLIEYAYVREIILALLYLSESKSEGNTNIATEITITKEKKYQGKKVTTERKVVMNDNYVTTFAENHRFNQSHVNLSSRGVGTKKRPHVRKGHLSHYWVGKGDDKTLVEKWINPSYINYTKENNPSTTIKVN